MKKPRHATTNPAKLPPAGQLPRLFGAAHDAFPELRKQHYAALMAVFNAPDDRVVLYPCFVDGKATSAIGIIDTINNAVVVVPLFIAPTATMQLTGHAGQSTLDWPYDGGVG